jgi:predicted nucleic acid-binding protein
LGLAALSLGASAVLVDTSVWIDHLRGSSTVATATLAGWLAEDADRILVNEVVTTELLRGAGKEADANQLQAALSKLPQAPPIRVDDWWALAQIYRQCRHAGLTVRSPMDCLIAAHAIRLKVRLLATDRDFEAIAACTPLTLHATLAQ